MKTYKVLRACDFINFYELMEDDRLTNFYDFMKSDRLINFYKLLINKKKTLPRSRNIKFNFMKAIKNH